MRNRLQHFPSGSGICVHPNAASFDISQRSRLHSRLGLPAQLWDEPFSAARGGPSSLQHGADCRLLLGTEGTVHPR